MVRCDPLHCAALPALQAVEEALACIRVQRAYDVHALLGAVDQLLKQHAKQPQVRQGCAGSL